MSDELSYFLDHVSFDETQIPGMMLCCWDWTGAVDYKGRPRFSVKRSGKLARRALFEVLIDKKLPAKGAVVALCGNRQCVRPEHLFLCNNTSGVDLQTMWAHFLMPIDVIVSGWAISLFHAWHPASSIAS